LASLTPARKKTVRNPRVKKKQKYAEKLKKQKASYSYSFFAMYVLLTKLLQSMKQVFNKTAAAKGAASYGGEMTGIKPGLVRSRKL
jgi:U3 small nucleolar RNA-associated protein 3